MTDSHLTPQEEVRVIALDYARQLIDYGGYGSEKHKADVGSLIDDAAKIEKYILGKAT